MAESLIECLDVHHTYMPGTPMEASALRGVTVRIDAGESVAILGPTGSGKSTLIQHFNALLRPTAGTVKVVGEDLWAPRMDRRRARHRVGLVFQFPEYQLFEETVEADVGYGPRNLGFGGDEVAKRVDEALRSVGLEPGHFAPRSPFTLSGGEMRRVALAGVLAMQPQVLVLDEPTAGLDPRGKEELLERIEALHRRGQTVVIVSHTMDEVARLARRIVVMFEGRIVLDGPTREAFARAEDLHRWGLGLPQVAELIRTLREHGMDIDDALTPTQARGAILAAWKRAHGSR
jgi:energy-coupling factor transport system ATP-binding protein